MREEKQASLLHELKLNRAPKCLVHVQFQGWHKENFQKLLANNFLCGIDTFAQITLQATWQSVCKLSNIIVIKATDLCFLVQINKMYFACIENRVGQIRTPCQIS